MLSHSPVSSVLLRFFHSFRHTKSFQPPRLRLQVSMPQQSMPTVVTGANALLTVDVVPVPCWWANLRSVLPKYEWDYLRRTSYRKANWLCEICGGKGKKHPVDCHEIWEYDDAKHVQSLKGLISLCPPCHNVKHIGLSERRGKGDEARMHLRKVNGWTREEAEQHIQESLNVCAERSKHVWTFDYDSLVAFGINPAQFKQGRRSE